MFGREDLVQAISEIASWSKANFGEQEGDGLHLGRVAPLLGIFEEIYEYIFAQTVEEALDALGDIAIFLVDYLSRCGKAPEDIASLLLDVNAYNASWAECLYLARHELKRVQGIRGYKDKEQYDTMRDDSVRDLINVVNIQLKRFNKSGIAEILLETWESVKKRNWKKNPENGTGDNLGAKLWY